MSSNNQEKPPIPKNVVTSTFSPLLNALPSGDNKKKNRHSKTTSQPLQLEASQQASLQRDYDAQRVGTLTRIASEEQPDVIGTSEEEETRSSTGLHFSLGKRFPKMSLSRGISTDKHGNSTSGRSRSPSKDTTSFGGLLRYGNLNAIKNRLVPSKHSDEKEEIPNASVNRRTSAPISGVSSPSSSPTPTIPTTVEVEIRNKDDENEEGSSRNEKKIFSGARTSLSDLPRPIALDVRTSNSTKDDMFATEDLSPVFLSEKASSISSVNSQLPSDVKIDSKEVDTWRKIHNDLETNMSKTVKGASLLAVTPRPKRSSLTDRTEIVAKAALTLEENNRKKIKENELKLKENERRLKLLEIKVLDYQKRADELVKEAKLVREELIRDCQQLMEQVKSTESQMQSNLDSLSQKEIAHRERINKHDHDLKIVRESVSEAVGKERKNFDIIMNDGENRLRNLQMGVGRGVAMNQGIIDSVFHSFQEMILLGSGTLLSILSSIFVFIRALLPCLTTRKKRRS